MSETAATPISIRAYRGKTDNIGKPVTLADWPTFVAYLGKRLKATAATKDALPLIGPHTLRKGGKRNLAGVGSVTLGAIDIDKNIPDPETLIAEICRFGFAAVVHTSPSDPQPDTRKLRVYFPLSRPCEPRECGLLRKVIGDLLSVTIDDRALDPSRFLYVGVVRGTPARELWEIKGEPLDVDELLALAPAPGSGTRATALQPIAAPTGDAAKAIKRFESRIAALHEILEPHYEEGPRHPLVRAVSGWLASNFDAWHEAAIIELIRRLPSDKVSFRVEQAIDAVRQKREGKTPTPGWEELSRIVGPDDAARLELAVMSESDRRLSDPKCKAERRANREAKARVANTNAGPGGEEFAPAANESDATTPANDQRTDLGNARRFVRGYRDSLRYFEARKLWYAWDGTRWKVDNTGEVVRAAKDAAESLWLEAKAVDDDDKRKAAYKWAAQCQDRARLVNMIELAKSEPGIPVVAADLDAHPWLLNVQNGTLDLRTGKLSAPDPALLMTKCCATHFEPDARSDLWEAFVKRTTGNDAELAAYIQRSLGYALYGAWAEKAFWFGYGPPDGAKSTLLGAIGDVLGDYHVAAAASTWMVQNNVGGNRGDVTRLLGARFVTSLEIRPGLRFDEELVKKVTGGDTIVAAGKYENEIQFPPTFALWMGANDRPTIRDDDEGMWSRMRCVPFTNPVPDHEKDPHLREKLTSPEHAPAVLAWLVAGCIAWQRDGIGKCAAVTTATKAYRADMNRAGAFFEECCEVGEGYETAAKAMRNAYDNWCRANGVRNPLAANALGRRLRALGATGGDDASKRTITEAVGTFPATRDRFWTGVRLREE